MKVLSWHMHKNLNTVDKGFAYLVSTFRDSIKSWDHFVNWDKVYINAESLRRELHLWNSLLGSERFDEEFLSLLEEYPHIVRAIPALVVRDGKSSSKFQVTFDLSAETLEQIVFDFSEPATRNQDREKALLFVKKTGLERLFTESGTTNLLDYMIGVEAGLDSNGRKNRSGKTMEYVVEQRISKIASQLGLEWLSQATPKKVLNQWGLKINVDKSSRSFDFALSDGEKVLLVEANFYGAGGSKLKSVAGEFSQLARVVSTNEVSFVWITDGKGWSTALRPLREAYEKVDHVLNLSMLSSGYIESFFQGTRA